MECIIDSIDGDHALSRTVVYQMSGGTYILESSCFVSLGHFFFEIQKSWIIWQLLCEWKQLYTQGANQSSATLLRWSSSYKFGMVFQLVSGLLPFIIFILNNWQKSFILSSYNENTDTRTRRLMESEI